MLTCGLLSSLHKLILLLAVLVDDSALGIDLLLTSLDRLRSSLFLRQKLWLIINNNKLL